MGNRIQFLLKKFVCERGAFSRFPGRLTVKTRGDMPAGGAGIRGGGLTGLCRAGAAADMGSKEQFLQFPVEAQDLHQLLLQVIELVTAPCGTLLEVVPGLLQLPEKGVEAPDELAFALKHSLVRIAALGPVMADFRLEEETAFGCHSVKLSQEVRKAHVPVVSEDSGPLSTATSERRSRRSMRQPTRSCRQRAFSRMVPRSSG